MSTRNLFLSQPISAGTLVWASLLVTTLLLLSRPAQVNAFVEDYFIDVDDDDVVTTPRTTTTTTSTTTPTPSPDPSHDLLCHHFCLLNLGTCKDILNEFLFGWISGNRHYPFLNQPTYQGHSPQAVCRYSHDVIWSRCLSWSSSDHFRCPPSSRAASQNCPRDSILSGFGSSPGQRARCMPLSLCKYLSKVYLHVNEMHEDVHWT